MMLDAADFAAGGQQLVEMTPPPSWVLAVPIALDLGPIQHRLDAATNAARRLRLGRPNRLQDPAHENGVDGLNWEWPDDRLGIGGERCGPLRRVLRVAPAGTMRPDVIGGSLFEGDRLCALKNSLRPGGLACLDRIDALRAQPPTVCGLQARLLKTNRVERSEPHLAGFAGKHVAVAPTFRRRAVNCADRDLEVEPAPICVHAGRFYAVYQEGFKSTEPSH